MEDVADEDEAVDWLWTVGFAAHRLRTAGQGAWPRRVRPAPPSPCPRVDPCGRLLLGP